MRTFNLKVFPTRARLNGASHQTEGVELIFDDGYYCTFIPGAGNFKIPADAPKGTDSGMVFHGEFSGYAILTLNDEDPLNLSATLTILDD